MNKGDHDVPRLRTCNIHVTIVNKNVEQEKSFDSFVPINVEVMFFRQYTARSSSVAS